jgi:deoxyribodipyrimidine photo-lyase
MEDKIVLFWFRRDLRLHDNHGLLQALTSGLPVLPVFIFDTEILEKLNSKTDARVSFIHAETRKIKTELEKNGSSLKIFHSTPLDALKELVETFDVVAVYSNKDYEPAALKRDKKIKTFLKDKGIEFLQFKDQVIFEENEVQKDDETPYTVFTPYSKKWNKTLKNNPVSIYESGKELDKLLKVSSSSFPKLKELGFEESDAEFPSRDFPDEVIRNYAKVRDFPAEEEGTTRLGIHLRFGTVSIRELVQKAAELSDVFLNELVWREFYMSVLWHFPQVVNKSFKPKYDFINWRNNEGEFQAWCEGRTGYPIVDAGMRELNSTGFMHNRVRMITASFLTKHLLIDWRWGEAYFARKLLDFDLASNNGGWQWAAGSGTDAAPYFRVFNPYTQREKFDKDWTYVKRWIPEINSSRYPDPIVEHKLARERCLATYKEGLERGKA